jgi:hypothetical protein
LVVQPGRCLAGYFTVTRKLSVSLCVFVRRFNNDWSSNIPVDSQAIIHLAGKAHILSIHLILLPNNCTKLTKSFWFFYLNSEIQDFIYFSSVRKQLDSVEELLKIFIGSQKNTVWKTKLLAEEYILEAEIHHTRYRGFYHSSLYDSWSWK